VAGPAPNGVLGGMIALVAIFTSSFLLVFGLLPFWDDLRRRPDLRRALTGVNAAVVGLLLAALYAPIWTAGIRGPADFVLGLAAFTALVFWKLPPWLVVILSALGGWLIGLV
ncbi:MAG: chromate transporter, partial [Pseudomonadota bacterium]